MQAANPLWGALPIHGELRKLGIEIAQATVTKYLARHLQHYLIYHHGWRAHLSLDKDAPVTRATQPPPCGAVAQVPHLGGSHHDWERRTA